MFFIFCLPPPRLPTFSIEVLRPGTAPIFFSRFWSNGVDGPILNVGAGGAGAERVGKASYKGLNFLSIYCLGVAFCPRMPVQA